MRVIYVDSPVTDIEEMQVGKFYDSVQFEADLSKYLCKG